MKEQGITIKFKTEKEKQYILRALLAGAAEVKPRENDEKEIREVIIRATINLLRRGGSKK